MIINTSSWTFSLKSSNTEWSQLLHYECNFVRLGLFVSSPKSIAIRNEKFIIKFIKENCGIADKNQYLCFRNIELIEFTHKNYLIQQSHY